MELPDLGKHCSERSCLKLDFLPVKCDACSKVFCGAHFSYSAHSCPLAYTRNAQVPVCPLCNQAIDCPRGELPDVRVGRHIDDDCRITEQRKKVDTNKCMMAKCKTKELIPIVCGDCKLNFCLKHRHPIDHKCPGQATAKDRAREAAMARLSGQNSGPAPAAAGARQRPNTASSSSAAAKVQGNMSEDEALARALQLSMQSGAAAVGGPQQQPQGAAAASAGQATAKQVQEEEDRLLAEALARSEGQTVGGGGRGGATTGSRDRNNCAIS